jgi:YidC/Oxa1 family membrane protein insertase
LGALYHFFGAVMLYPIEFFVRYLHSYGLAIVLVTVLVRVVLAPISIRQFESMRQMQLLQPEMKALQERYKGDPQKLQQAQAELFREYKVNPFAGCLPLLLQLPFLWGLFYALMHINYHNAGFIWIPNLSGRDPYYILPLLSGLTTLLSTQMTSSASLQTQDRTQQIVMMLLMPAIIVYFTIRYPAGLALYWTVSQILTVGQQWLFFRRRPTLPGRGQGAGDARVQHAR